MFSCLVVAQPSKNKGCIVSLIMICRIYNGDVLLVVQLLHLTEIIIKFFYLLEAEQISWQDLARSL